MYCITNHQYYYLSYYHHHHYMITVFFALINIITKTTVKTVKEDNFTLQPLLDSLLLLAKRTTARFI